MVAGALLALLAAVGLLAASLFSAAATLLAWLSVGADVVAALLLVGALRRRRPGHPPGARWGPSFPERPSTRRAARSAARSNGLRR